MVGGRKNKNAQVLVSGALWGSSEHWEEQMRGGNRSRGQRAAAPSIRQTRAPAGRRSQTCLHRLCWHLTASVTTKFCLRLQGKELGAFLELRFS